MKVKKPSEPKRSLKKGFRYCCIAGCSNQAVQKEGDKFYCHLHITKKMSL